MIDKKLLIGQRLSVGFDGPVIPKDFIDLVREYKVGNVILFRRNVQSYEQLRSLCADIRTLILNETGLEPYIMLDEECGRVSRLEHIAAATPCALAIGATGDPENARKIGRLISEELRAAGINFNLAPVLDCLTHPEASDGNRCFATEPEKVAEFGCAYIEGLQEGGVLGCAKHFPGHGDTNVDSHLALPVVDKPYDVVWNRELVSFRAAIAAGVKGIMSAHVVFPAFEPERIPGTVSRNVITGLMREKLGFNGIILSDGMEMNAVMDMFGIEEGTRRALAAGIDIALICHSADQARAACNYLYEALENGTLDRAETEERYQHIAACKRSLPLKAGCEDQFGNAEQRAFAKAVMREAVRVWYAPQGQPLPKPGPDTVFLGVPARAATQASDDIPLNAAARLAEDFGGRYLGLDEAVPEGAKGAVVILDRHPELPKALEAVRRLAAAGIQVTAVSMNVPFILRDLPENVWQVEAWQYDRFVLEVLKDLLEKGKGQD